MRPFHNYECCIRGSSSSFGSFSSRYGGVPHSRYSNVVTASRPERCLVYSGEMSAPASGGGHQLLSPRRMAAAAAIVLLLAACISDFVFDSFWTRHAMFTDIVSTILVALVSLTVVQVVLEERAEQRWRLLAQYGLFELADNANITWLT